MSIIVGSPEEVLVSEEIGAGEGAVEIEIEIGGRLCYMRRNCEIG